MTGWRIEKRDYSRHPWRIVTADGHEVTRLEDFDHPGLGRTRIAVAGYPSKQAAIEGLGEFAALYFERIRSCGACSFALGIEGR